MKVIIAGSRTITPSMFQLSRIVRDSSFKIDTVVCGLAKGVDLAGKEWAEIEGIRVKEFPAKWNQYGSKAGILRNEEMGRYADALIAIWDGESRGTDHMIKYMQKLKKPMFIHMIPTQDEYENIKAYFDSEAKAFKT
jgi:hypothetical protein